MQSAVIVYDEACRAIAECKTIPEIKDFRDKICAVQEYARRANNRELEVDAAEIRIRCERRLGEVLSDIKGSGGLRVGRPLKDESRANLAELGVSHKLSASAQSLAQPSSSAFEKTLLRWRRDALEAGIAKTKSPKFRGRDAARGSLFDHITLGSGRAIGATLMGTVKSLADEHRKIAALLDRIADHYANPDPSQRVRDALSEAELEQMLRAVE